VVGVEPRIRTALAAQLNRLFITRDDLYGLQKPDNSYFVAREPLTGEVLEHHLDGKKTVLAYTLSKDSTVKYVCWDVDVKNADMKAARGVVMKMLDACALHGVGDILVEFSGGKGYHIFRFVPPGTSAKDAREYGRRIVHAAGLSEKKEDDIHVEVFPKQDLLGEGTKVGNGIKLPMCYHQSAGKWSYFVDIYRTESNGAEVKVSFDDIGAASALNLLVGTKTPGIDLEDIPPLAEIKVSHPPNKPKKPGRTETDSAVEAIKQHLTILNLEPTLTGAPAGEWADAQTCPFDTHQGKPFSIFGDGEAFKCHSCDKEGDVLSFYELNTGVPFKEAKAQLLSMLPTNVRPKKKGTGLTQRLGADGKEPPVFILAAEDILRDWNIAFIAETGRTYIYQEGRYQLDHDRRRIKRRATALLGDRYSINARSNAAELVCDRSLRFRVEFENNIDLLNLKNGILDLNTMQLQPHTPDYLSFELLPVDFVPSADCPEWLNFLSQVVNPGDIGTLQEYCGYCLYKSNPYEKALMLTGVGSNGKSVFMDIWKQVLGRDNYASLTPQSFDRDSQALLELTDKLVNICADVPSQPIRDTSVIKKMMSSDTVTVRPLYSRDQVKFESRCKLIIGANQAPAPKYDDSVAYFRRWLIVPFPNTFSPGKPGFIRKDDLEATLLKEVSGILNWALTGFTRLTTQGHFSDTRSAEEMRVAYEEAQEPVIVYVAERIQQGDNDRISKDDLYEDYAGWCKARGVSLHGKIAFGRRFQTAAPFVRQGKMGGRGERINCWINLIFSMEPIIPDTSRTQEAATSGPHPGHIPDKSIFSGAKTIPDTSQTNPGHGNHPGHIPDTKLHTTPKSDTANGSVSGMVSGMEPLSSGLSSEGPEQSLLKVDDDERAKTSVSGITPLNFPLSRLRGREAPIDTEKTVYTNNTGGSSRTPTENFVVSDKGGTNEEMPQVSLVALCDLPDFMGKDNKAYKGIKEGAKFTLPSLNAAWLLKSKMARPDKEEE